MPIHYNAKLLCVQKVPVSRPDWGTNIPVSWIFLNHSTQHQNISLKQTTTASCVVFEKPVLNELRMCMLVWSFGKQNYTTLIGISVQNTQILYTEKTWTYKWFIHSSLDFIRSLGIDFLEQCIKSSIPFWIFIPFLFGNIPNNTIPICCFRCRTGILWRANT